MTVDVPLNNQLQALDVDASHDAELEAPRRLNLPAAARAPSSTPPLPPSSSDRRGSRS